LLATSYEAKLKGKSKGVTMATTSKPIALLYVRVSTNRQAKSGHSLDSQPALLTEAAERDGYQVEVITETGSGRNTARPELNKALERLAKGEAQALYALDTDRLARSTMHLLQIAQQANRQKWRLVITSANVDTSTPAGEAFLTMAAAFAQFESRMISERVKRQHQARRERGEVWGVTMGLQSKLPTETRDLILSLRAEGMSLGKIANHLTAEGVPTASGGNWYASTVSRVLNSPQSQQVGV
jgi:DNA invertase Pin-like site-specific DNA recombinase